MFEYGVKAQGLRVRASLSYHYSLSDEDGDGDMSNETLWPWEHALLCNRNPSGQTKVLSFTHCHYEIGELQLYLQPVLSLFLSLSHSLPIFPHTDPHALSLFCPLFLSPSLQLPLQPYFLSLSFPALPLPLSVQAPLNWLVMFWVVVSPCHTVTYL